MDRMQQIFEGVKAGDMASVEALIEGDPALVNARDEMGNSALLLALYYGHREIADILLAKGAVLNIFEASAAGKTDNVKQLLEGDASLIRTYSHDGFTALHLAAFFGHPELLNFLLDKGANPNAVAHNPMSVTPLHSAAAHYQPDVATQMVAALIEHGADVNAKQEGGFTALHSAAQNGNIGLIRLLLDHRADPQARSQDGKTPRDLAVESKHEEAAKLL
jgi:ankyrin repeat protein